MRKLVVSLIACLLVWQTIANATAYRTQLQNLTISGTPITAYAIATNQTVTSDSIYVNGKVGMQSLAVVVGGKKGALTIKYQVSYDNSNWWTPYVATVGTLTSIDTLASGITSDRWIIMPETLTPYVRFTFSDAAVTTDSITSETLWQTAD